jgi:8-oxo-dGTP diphosphatase
MGMPITSAGGVLFRRDGSDFLIVIVEQSKGVEKKWAPVLRQLPKGTRRKSETLEETALREVLEETGFGGRIVGKAGEAGWSYEREGRMWDETVHYFFMEPTTLTPLLHDSEFELVRWVRIEEASRILSYPEERRLLTEILTSKRLP